MAFRALLTFHALVFVTEAFHQRRLPLRGVTSSGPSRRTLKPPRLRAHELLTDLPLALTGGGPSELWKNYLGLLDSAPLPTKALTAAVIIGTGDASAQVLEAAFGSEGGRKEQGTSPLDLARVGRWAAFGFFLQAPWNHFFYQVLDGALPPTAEPFTQTTLVKVAIDQFGQAPIFTVRTLPKLSSGQEVYKIPYARVSSILCLRLTIMETFFRALGHYFLLLRRRRGARAKGSKTADRR